VVTSQQWPKSLVFSSHHIDSQSDVSLPLSIFLDPSFRVNNKKGKPLIEKIALVLCLKKNVQFG
jgi:hypothetical protein